MSGINCRCVPVPVVEPTDHDDGDQLDHIVCCDPDLALCGADVADSEAVTEFDADDLPCVVCEDLNKVDTECGCSIACPIGGRS